MKNKFVVSVCMLMLCMGIFYTPALASSEPDETPPTLTAVLNGDVLHMEAADENSGVEAVYVNGYRINYRVDGALDVVFKDYAGNSEFVTVQAIDFAGNKSKAIQIKNPYYTAPKTTAKPAETPMPAEPTPEPETVLEPAQANPLTPDGTGTVMDNVTEQNGKEFFTITTPDDNVFYLVIDRQRDNENVYLLNAVTEDDLAALAEKSKDSGKSQSVIPAPVPEVTPTSTPTPEPEPEPKKESGGGTLIFLLIAVAAAGGAGYYIKIYKPKQQAPVLDDDFEDDEEMEYEDDTEDDYSVDGDYPDYEAPETDEE